MALNSKRITYDVTFKEYAAAFMVAKVSPYSSVIDSILGIELIVAKSQQDAESKVLDRILLMYSVNDGYVGHKVTAISIFNRDKFNGTE